jgi:hypothetical protein
VYKTKEETSAPCSMCRAGDRRVHVN